MLKFNVPCAYGDADTKYLTIFSDVIGEDITYDYLKERISTALENGSVVYDNGQYTTNAGWMDSTITFCNNIVDRLQNLQPHAEWKFYVWDSRSFCGDAKSARYSVAIEPGLLELAKKYDVNISRAARAGIVQAIGTAIEIKENRK